MPTESRTALCTCSLRVLVFVCVVQFKGALAIAFLCAALHLGTPLYAIQLLWVNLIMDSIGALALATEPPTDDVLLRPPINAAHPKTWLVNPNMMKNIGGQAIYQVVILMLGVYLLPSIPNISQCALPDGTTVCRYTPCELYINWPPNPLTHSHSLTHSLSLSLSHSLSLTHTLCVCRSLYNICCQ
jgi:magnesium-transporting ATPase (P-type)